MLRKRSRVRTARKARKRGRDSIIIDILSAALRPQKKMRIMYKANLNFDRFKKYFGDLQERGFIEEVEDASGKASYRTSERGRMLLTALRNAQDLMLSQSG